ncbi:GATOR complex protein WDR24 isoform X2 [Drosophila gunungcola]|uniref:GATOR complex protein WDR24 isoform X2 n=1 Tax=Drosophila gunungcola TaxID=103775 RepID=UPI0022E7F667|nr:GATOR complex protein WDR24 isoform X2 [Drosophila gunungcola]
MPDSLEEKDTSTISLRICVEGHANALVLNKDNNQVALAGRSLLKVYAINSNGFTESCNMRGKNQNLSYSANDVAWSTLDSNLLATAATNGVVSVWDLSKFGRQKQLLVYNEHERTANTVTFHSSEPNILISGSQDGTIKCFDIRSDKSVNTYFCNSESVRDVKFSPHTQNIFSAVSENGTVQLWDMRKWDKCMVQFTAHYGPVYTCDWHPTRNWLATGSRDKQIKVWNMDGRPGLEHTIHTIAVVGRVKWRPERTYHIASCALVVDYSVHVWDIRRPYIPFASFNEHTNVTTGIAWQGSDSHCLLSISKDSTIYKHAFKDATRPAMKANAQGASLGRFGDISFVNKIKEYAPKASGASNTKSSSFIRRKPNVAGSIQFHLDHSKMYKIMVNETFSGYPLSESVSRPTQEHESFIGCARELIISGKKLSELCEHNAEVSKKYGKHNATTLWNFIKLFYGSNHFEPPFEHRSSFSNQKNPMNSRRATQVASDWPQQRSELGQDLNGNTPETAHEIDVANVDDDPLGGSGVEHPPTSSVILSETQIISEITFDNFELLRNGFIFVGPTECAKALAFPALHHDVQAARPQLDLKASDHEKSPPPHVPTVLKVSHAPPIPMWEPHKFVSDALMLMNDVGDVQTALTVLIALGEARKLLPIEDTLVEHWFYTYVDQLHRYELWNEACEVINRSWLRSVQQINQHSTAMHTNCGECGRPMGGKVGWYCDKCKSMQSAKCCVCGLIVRGLYAWCQGCSHGGHIEHLQKYFAKHSKCPKCGHMCSYS